MFVKAYELVNGKFIPDNYINIKDITGIDFENADKIKDVKKIANSSNYKRIQCMYHANRYIDVKTFNELVSKGLFIGL